MKLLGVSGTIVGEKTAILVNKVLKKVNDKYPNIETELLDLRSYNMEFSDGRPISQYNKDTQTIINKMLDADFFLFGTPVFNGSIPAPLKNLFDLMHPSTLRHKVMGVIATGGTYQHYLMVENQLKPITGYLRAFTTPSYVYAHNSHFDENNMIVDEELIRRIDYLVDELLYMQTNLGQYKGNNKQSESSDKKSLISIGRECIKSG